MRRHCVASSWTTSRRPGTIWPRCCGGRGCVGPVSIATDAIEALRLLGRLDVDVVFVETRIPGLDGREFSGVLRLLRTAPAVVFVSRRRQRDTDPPEAGAVAYLRKPALPDRLTAALRWAATSRSPGSARCGPARRSGPAAATPETGGPVIPVKVGRTTKLVPVAAVRWAEACHDYVRLYTADGCYLIRARLTALVDSWQPYGGLVRIHRSYLVGSRFVAHLHRVRSGQFAVVIDGRQLPVSRRYLPQIRERWGLVVGQCAG
jgi:DNA-binding LytR/AlgR family response regulator